ncbi:MAG: hypothetical protein JHC95_09105 [Solirubrobacteraceae bacterium]|nr:hypothetical protein [Solirubrobacteraceae bacterium]
MSELEELGPIDYIIIEWPDKQPQGAAIPHLLDLVENGLIRILDLVFVTKGDDGSIAAIEIGELGDSFAVFDGVTSGLIGDAELAEAGEVLEPGTSAAILLWENTWAAPFAIALRKSGAQLVASGRIPVQQIVAALDAVETTA